MKFYEKVVKQIKKEVPAYLLGTPAEQNVANRMMAEKFDELEKRITNIESLQAGK